MLVAEVRAEAARQREEDALKNPFVVPEAETVRACCTHTPLLRSVCTPRRTPTSHPCPTRTRRPRLRGQRSLQRGLQSMKIQRRRSGMPPPPRPLFPQGPHPPESARVFAAHVMGMSWPAGWCMRVAAGRQEWAARLPDAGPAASGRGAWRPTAFPPLERSTQGGEGSKATTRPLPQLKRRRRLRGRGECGVGMMPSSCE